MIRNMVERLFSKNELSTYLFEGWYDSAKNKSMALHSFHFWGLRSPTGSCVVILGIQGDIAKRLLVIELPNGLEQVRVKVVQTAVRTCHDSEGVRWVRAKIPIFDSSDHLPAPV